ncbi:MAG: DsbA family protein [Saprospiraceae bacterium]|nr:DsbA family protein [Saprospiraceae bacterium]
MISGTDFRNLQSNAASKPVLYYVYDPLCGWCYGFSPVITKIHENWKEKIDIEVISGGMILEDRVGPVSEVAPYIKTAYKRVEESTGVKFGEAYLADLLGEGKTIMNSWYLCVAVTVFKSFDKQNQVAFASALQKAVYFNGMAPEDTEGIAKLAGSFGLDPKAFKESMDSEEMKYATKQEFQFAQDLSATGFPTLVIKVGEEYFLMARGYVSYEVLSERLEKAMQPATK